MKMNKASYIWHTTFPSTTIYWREESIVDEVEEFLNGDDLPGEAIASFKEKYQLYLALEGEETVQPTFTFFEPAKAAIIRGGGDPDYISYYTYNGWPMMSYHFIIIQI